MTDGGQDFDLGQVVGSDGATGNGVASVTLISTSGKVKTYRMLFTDGTYVDYQVTDGSDASVTIVTSWNSTTSNSKVPSERLTKDSLDNKVDKETGKGLFSGSYTDLSNKPSIPSSSSDLSDGSDLVKKSNTSGLLKNDGTVDTTSYSTQNVWYGTCSTSGTEQTKVVDGVSNWSFTTGNLLFVKFSYANNYDGTSKLEIGNVSKDVVTTGTTKTSRYHWRGGELVGFVYDGTNFTMLEEGTASTSYYGVTKLEDSVTSTSTTTSATPNSVKTAYDLAKSKISTSDIANNLTTDDATKVLSAKQGKVLNDLIGDAIAYINQ